VAGVEVSEGLEGVGTGDVRVQDKEGGVVLAQDFTGEGEGTGGTERLGLDGEGDGDAVLFLGLFEHSDHDLGSVVDGEDNVLDTGLDKGVDLVQDHSLVAELDQRLGEGQGQGPETGTESTDENQSLHFVKCVFSKERGVGGKVKREAEAVILSR